MMISPFLFLEHVGFAVEVYNTKKNATVLVGKTSEARLSPTRVGHENENDFQSISHRLSSFHQGEVTLPLNSSLISIGPISIFVSTSIDNCAAVPETDERTHAEWNFRS